MRQQDLRLFEHFPTRLRGGLAVLAIVSLSVLASACGGGGGDEGDNGDGGNNVDVNFAGDWSVTQTVQDTCGAGNYTESYIITIEGQGADLTLDDGSEMVDLEVNDDTVSWSAEYSEDGYTTTIEGHATVSGDTISGVSDWSVSGPDISCGGTSTFQGTRVTDGTDDGSTGGSTDGDGSGADDEEMEPNDSWETATLISLSGSSVTYAGNVDDTNDVSDYFSFTPGASGSYTITLNGLDEMDDIDLAVRDSNGNVLDSSEDFGPDEAVTIILSAGLVYYIEVYGYETLTGADYELTVARN